MLKTNLSFWLSANGMLKLLGRLLVGGAIGAAIQGGYLFLQRVTLRPVWWLEPGVFESWIPVSSSAASVSLYLSFYLLALVPGLLISDREFRRYLIAIAISGVVSLTVFWLVPSGVLRDSVAVVGASPAYLNLIEVDLPRNAFPSLHASISLLAGVAGGIVFQNGIARALLWVWVGAVLWSTVATRQHVLFDVFTGSLLAVVAWSVADRVQDPPKPSS